MEFQSAILFLSQPWNDGVLLPAAAATVVDRAMNLSVPSSDLEDLQNSICLFIFSAMAIFTDLFPLTTGTVLFLISWCHLFCIII